MVVKTCVWMLQECCCSIAQLCPTLCEPMDCSTPDLPVLHCLRNFLKFLSIETMMSSNHLIFCHPLLLLLSIFPSIRVFFQYFGHQALHFRWLNYWSFSLSVSPSNEHSGLISFRIESLMSLLSKGSWRLFSNTIIWKYQLFGIQLSWWKKEWWNVAIEIHEQWLLNRVRLLSRDFTDE